MNKITTLILLILFFLNNSLTAAPIDEFKKIYINGASQQIWIRGNDTRNPLLIFLHGGPGEPHMSIAGAETNLLTDHFTVVQWDQRGAGASYSEDITPESLTVEQMEEDAITLIKYLTQKFKQKKVYLLGHSWGAYLGTKISHKYPQYIRAFIAVGLPVNMRQTYPIMKNQLLRITTNKIKRARAFGDSMAAQKLWRIGEALSKFNITDILENKDWDSFINFYFNPRVALGFSSSIHPIRGGNPHISTDIDKKDYSNKLEKSMDLYADLVIRFFNRKITDEVKKIEVPIFAIHGRHDFNVEPYAAEAYISHLTAPCKITSWFENSAHMMTFEEPEKFKNFMINKVLNLKACKKK
ncbi:MAG: alpha/beta hydrolase [Bdellovibrionaceae bacterium]|nr:alpha/beta hydrolase [Pseudobdellovibrionaceae bacterium]